MQTIGESVITIFTPSLNARIQYISAFVCMQLLGADVLLTDQEDIFRKATGPRICYGTAKVSPPAVCIPLHPIMTENRIENHLPRVNTHLGQPAFFHVDTANSDYPFDLFAQCFYMISRYEEYLDFRADQHGRFPATESFAAKNSFLHIPLVDLWVSHLGEKLEAIFPQFTVQKPPYRFIPSYDIDMAWAYLYKGWWRISGAAAKDLLQLEAKRLVRRISVLVKKTSDPYDNFGYMEQLNTKYALHPIFFYLLGKHAEFDKNIPPEHPAMQNLIKRLSRDYLSGLHPSYQSNDKASLLLEEKTKLENIIGIPVIRSRQHFVKLSFPETYRNLLACGITDDYSMGFAGMNGFRAGTSVPFRWYDLEREEPTSLVVHPFQLMDVTLQQYLSLSPQQAKDHIDKIVLQVKQFGGELVSIWHNSSLADQDEWHGWREVYEHLLQQAVNK